MIALRATIFVILLVVIAVAAGEYHQGSLTATMNVGTDTTGDGSSYFSQHVAMANTIDFTAGTGRIIVRPSGTTLHGLGTQDTAIIAWTTTKRNVAVVLQTDTVEGLPCTTNYAFIDGDTLMGKDLYATVLVRDTTNDTVFTADYLIEYNMHVRGK